jgi:predicted phage tail protein
MRSIKLYGHLGRRFGKLFRFDVASPAEAVRALCANLRGFEQALVGHAPGYNVFVGSGGIGADDLTFQSGADDIRIVPLVAGAKSGVGQVIVGALIIIAAFYTGGAAYAAAGGLTYTAAGGIALSLGASMVIGGVTQLLTGAPAASNPKERPGSDPSYAFNGVVNTTAQGNPVPVCYGRMIVGSQVISAGLSVTQLYVAPPIVTPPASPATSQPYYGGGDYL